MEWDMKIGIRGAELPLGEFDLHAIGTAERIRLRAMCVEHR
jgi:hypothetical protein